MTDDRETQIARLRDTADLLDRHPELPVPLVGHGVSWTLYKWDCEDVPAVTAHIRRTIGGKWDKSIQDYSGNMVFTRDHYRITVQREAVCTRKVVGTKTKTLPAQEALPERTVEEEIVEWDCEPILAASEA